MTKIAFVFFLAFVVPTLLIGLYFILFIRYLNVRDLGTPFECGFDSKRSSRIPFSLRFFMLAVIFLIFDVEVALLFPLPFISRIGVGVERGVILGGFLFILLWGLFHE